MAFQEPRDLLSGIPAEPMAVARSVRSYVVRYDSGFAPNPFWGYCTLATCKPQIRSSAQVNDWIVGTGSDSRKVRRGGHLVYAMRVTEILTTTEYWNDPRFAKKKPNLHGSYRQACGDNIYYPKGDGTWGQLNSFHSMSDGTPNLKHIARDTGVQRVLVSDDFVYFGGEGPLLLDRVEAARDLGILKTNMGYLRQDDPESVASFEAWIRGLGVSGYQGRPWDIVASRQGQR